MNQEAAGGAQVHAALMDVYTTQYQPPEPRSHMLPAHSTPTATVNFLPEIFICWETFFFVRKGLWSDWMLIVHCYPLLALYSSLSLSALLHIQPSPSSALPCSLLLPLLLPVTALTVWLHVKAGAFCGSVTNLPGKTETICSGLGLRGDECVNTWV